MSVLSVPGSSNEKVKKGSKKEAKPVVVVAEKVTSPQSWNSWTPVGQNSSSWLPTPMTTPLTTETHQTPAQKPKPPPHFHKSHYQKGAPPPPQAPPKKQRKRGENKGQDKA
jgi:hypothetical protein